jgi:hypothetical protein
MDQRGKAGKTDLHTIASLGRETDESLAAVIAGKLDADPCFSARKLAQSLGIAGGLLPDEFTFLSWPHLHHA